MSEPACREHQPGHCGGGGLAGVGEGACVVDGKIGSLLEGPAVSDTMGSDRGVGEGRIRVEQEGCCSGELAGCEGCSGTSP